MRDVPPAIVQIVRGETQTMAAFDILLRIVVPEPFDRRLEAWAADHPRRVIDNSPVTPVSRSIGHALADFLAQWPAAEHDPPARRLQTFGFNALPNFLVAQRPAVNRWHRDVAIEKMLRDTTLRHRTEPQ